MHPLDAVPAIRRLDTSRDDLLAVEIAGPVTGADVENLYGLLEGAYALHERIDLLVRWPDGEDVAWTDIAADTLDAARGDTARHVGRCAAIGASGDISALLRRFVGPVGEVRRFPQEQEAEAWAWLGARETAENPT